jgi:predicted transcriptional regulator
MLTDAEAPVMSVLWEKQTASVSEVVSALKKAVKRAPSYSTVQTILRILEAKGYVAHQKVARAFIYRPLIDQRLARRRALKHLAARLFNDSPSLLVLNVLEDEQIDAAELMRLRKLIEDA